MMDASGTARINNAFERHKGRSDVSVDQHVRNTQIKLAKDLENRDAIYLDIKYWIILCEAILGRSKSDQDNKLLKIIIDLVENGKIFCPISEASFVELMKQEDMSTRRATAEIIDKLSLGVTLIPFEQRVGTEIAHFFYSRIDPSSTYPLKLLVWSKLSYVLGVVHPSNTVFDRDTELLLQKSFFDHMWNISLHEMIDIIGDNPMPSHDNFDALASNLNINIAEHADELCSYENTYLKEISGTVELFSGVALDILVEMAHRHGCEGEVGPDAENVISNLLREAYRKGKINTLVPTLDIYANLHASVRWNKRRQIKPNDIFDFYHASAALGYCQAFFTERSLCSLLTAMKISLAQRHNCNVYYKVSDAIAHLTTLKDERVNPADN